MLNALAAVVHRRPKRIVAAGAIVFAVAGALGGSVAKKLDPYGADDKASQSVQARKQLERATGLFPGVGLVALVRVPGGADSLDARTNVQKIASTIQRDPAVGRVTTYYDSGDPAMVSRDKRSTYVAADFRAISDKRLENAAKRIDKSLKGEPGVALGGFGVAFVQVNETVSKDLQRAELLAFPLLFLLSLLFFRSLVAALLPLLVGALSIVVTFLALRGYSSLTSVSVFALNLTTGLGLGLAIDYSLFVVSRYREELAKVGPGLEALRRTLATAGRTVVFSSLTVAAALSSLLVFPQRFLYSMGMGGATVAIAAMVISLTVLPAVLALLGERVNSFSPKRLQRAAARDARPAESGAWYRIARFVTRRPARIAIVTAVVMITIGIPFTQIKFTSVDPTVLPTSASARQVDDVLRSQFPPHSTEAIYLAVGAPRSQATSHFAASLRSLPGVASVSKPQMVGPHDSIVQVVSRHDLYDERSQDLVRTIRAQRASVPFKVGGATADFIDTKHSLTRHLPISFAVIAAMTILLLFLMTGSIVLPIKALIMNMLTLSAAFGLLVLVFQDGRFEGLLGYTSQGALESTMPVVLFAVVFGLSTDYGVFLLSRIKEARDNGASDADAVAIGLERTGRIVTAAATLFCVAIGAFATSRIIFIKENGVGTALAVLIDATLVRALLVPSLMELLGKWNWWAPRPLRRLHARFGITEGGAEATA